MKVDLLNVLGNDDSVVDAARVSFDKQAANYTPAQNAKLIYYLAEHEHWSPFAHTGLTFRIEAPIFVARQLAKHQIGLAWNEVSRRYVDYTPNMWMPQYFRKAAPSVKQGSSDEPVANERCVSDYAYATELAVRTYNSLLANGVCPEQARAVLPQGMMTLWTWTGSLYAFARVVRQRTTKYAQRETKEIAVEISQHCLKAFPVSWCALLKEAL
jgi:thymidylate synthase (FAD)